MGSFDILNYKIKCSKCRRQREWKIQIKAFVRDDRTFEDYPKYFMTFEDYPKYFKVNDEIITEANIIFGYGVCPNCSCQKDILIKIKNNKISEEYEFDNRNF